ncbi:MAG: GTP-binding protein [Promethearchaeota archaeon]
MLYDQKKLDALLQWYRQEVGKDLVLAIVAKNDGSVVDSIAAKHQIEVKTELIESVREVIKLIIQRIEDDFRLGSFGAGTFDTADYRFIFCRSGDESVFITLLNPLAMVDRIFPYSFLAAEKVARIFDDRPVSPVIPKLSPPVRNIDRKIGTFQKLRIHSAEYAYKLILVGDGAVGKTSMVHRFVEGEFRSDYQSTIGTAILKKECKFDGLKSRVRFVIWDLAGQAQFMRVRQSYLANAEAGLIVYDITRRKSFENITRWMEEIKKASLDKIFLILVGNKADLENDRVVTYDEGLKLAEELGMPFIETSAKTGERIDEAFRMIAFQLILGYIEVGDEYEVEQFKNRRKIEPSVRPTMKKEEERTKGLNEKEKEIWNFWNGLIKTIKKTSLHIPLLDKNHIFTYTLHHSFVSVELNFMHLKRDINYANFSRLQELRSEIQEQFSEIAWQLKNSLEWNTDFDKNHFYIRYRFKDAGLDYPYNWDTLYINMVDAMRTLIKILQPYIKKR